MLRFTTESGSVYEVDDANTRIRRLEGRHDATPRQGADGEWRVYHWISEVFLKDSVLIAWDAVGKATMTSRVESLVMTKD